MLLALKESRPKATTGGVGNDGRPVWIAHNCGCNLEKEGEDCFRQCISTADSQDVCRCDQSISSSSKYRILPGVFPTHRTQDFLYEWVVAGFLLAF
ncbi:receptor-type tyrosine-protein phosphatase C [Anopheles sinensis]|uniref:Receptor-type tyrosine-protein phosphatase C n=1 Tax=Anopheles sinensis TaxID=74873 RepID=A0A084WG69_ANOSI|nr:receptor-type tyrosine-protein phosphatase C [Anopheles sinensis]